MPASVTTATRSPRSSRSRTPAMARASVWSLTTISAGRRRRRAPGAGRCGACPRSRWRRRRPAPRRRGATRSPRLPMGVPTRTSGTGQSFRSSWSPTCRPHRAKAPASASSTLCARSTGRRHPVAGEAHGAEHGEVGVEPGHVDREAHPDRVHRPGGHEQERPVDAVAAEQPLAAGARAGRPPPATPAPPRRGATTASTARLRGGRPDRWRGQTLKRISRTSPSCTT